ncbi:tautomerase family protein [Paenibacillus mucilaginosus]|uniref:4-oxalocrotonate tautomerase YusQ n=1 Tax=Paenibacillus mucilaginosus (strain KNP414) TaxID=1036673 RepID=F8FKA6_PAEMK|nr:tautomerase family protein [Paenibacillus mucilaginosus]AEI44787.1 4-oxalocrotonate tautomerase YusQ [Paenibacillus mucilaginosus KNP414]MCG7214837.1 tautomerase family protein [Paenibacillus mucilaginosus]WDM26319.1 tautomerase family protein [Paenibacillus mucilaginosus]
MPFVRIDLRRGRTEEELQAVSRAVHRALTEMAGVPEDDYFQVITQHEAGEFRYDPGYLGISRTDSLIFIAITMGRGRGAETKRALYARTAQLLEESAGVRPEDVMIIVTENTLEDWSFGQGIAQHARGDRTGGEAR